MSWFSVGSSDAYAQAEDMDVDVLKIREKHAQEKKASKYARRISIDITVESLPGPHVN
jgi:hypothetical protein